ncbi:HAMP domain-containing histidine kinase [Micrococcus sp. ACRRV]|uniref:sensor histidine kinase n=1 Tax=Micrococcus sp. ACRRV TaxID=2918203 RepID=UPI001EF2FCF9|nr:HAMP domain-containing sensor histidine kinase [Micrococcus sp. ACRRV]MCG7423028.1 HAMP domain-containing histidine kinase [Micrococcus sp. ACRRV]
MGPRLGVAAARLRHPRTWLRGWWGARPLRTKLVVMITALMMVLVAVIALVTAVLFRTELLRQLDDDLSHNRDEVSIYLTTMSQTGGYYTPQQSILRFYGVVWDTSGRAVVSTPLMPGADGPALEGMTPEQVDAQGSASFEVPGTTAGSDGWRVQLYHLRSGEGSLAIALPLHGVRTSVERVVTLVVTIGLLGTAVSVVASNLLVERAFRALNRVERTAAKIAAGDLSQRVAYAPPSTEVGRLSRSLNAMLAHIETAFRDKEASEDKMRRFVQDASHELRTPLVTIRGFSELYRHGGITREEDVAAAMGRIESEAGRMHRLVEDLLTLARLDEQRPLEHEPVDLLVLGMDSMMDASVNAPDRKVSLVGLDGGPAGSAPLMGDENRMRQVVVNLMTNALRYTPEGTPIEIAVGTRDAFGGDSGVDGTRHSVIEIRDHGAGVSEEDAARIFERFYRADASRHRETGGTGLGLAIVAAIVAQHGGSVRLLETEGGGATFSVHLPWAALEDDADDDLDLEDDDARPGAGVPAGRPPTGGSTAAGSAGALETGQRRRLAWAGERFRRASAARRQAQAGTSPAQAARDGA